METEKLLDCLCRLDNCQGGTIHQFCNVFDDNFLHFLDMYEYCVGEGDIFSSKEQVISLAEECHYKGLKIKL